MPPIKLPRVPRPRIVSMIGRHRSFLKPFIQKLQASPLPDLSPELLEETNIDRHKLGFLSHRVEVLMSNEKQNPTRGSRWEEEKKGGLDPPQPDSSDLQ